MMRCAPLVIIVALLAGPAAATCTDRDSDGYYQEENCGGNGRPVDCNDTNAEINPGRLDVCDGIANDCDADLDEECRYVDCDDGLMGAGGRTADDPLVSMRTAADQLNVGGEIVVLPGTCPPEGGIRLADRMIVRGISREESVVQDSFTIARDGGSCYYPSSFSYTFADLTFIGAETEDDDCVGSVKMSRVTVDVLLLHLQYEQVVVEIEHSTLGNAVLGYAPILQLRNSSVTGTLTLHGQEGGEATIHQCNVAHIYFDWKCQLSVSRSHFAASTGAAINYSAGNQIGVLAVRDSTFTGYDTHLIVSGHAGTNGSCVRPVIERNTLGASAGDSIVHSMTGCNSTEISFSGNAFTGIGGAAIRHGAGVIIRPKFNNFDEVGSALCDAAMCFPTGLALNQAGRGVANLDAPSGFIGGSDYHLAPGSALIDQGKLGDGTESWDADGYSRPVDGDGDGTARHDIGAYESDDLDEDGIRRQLDNCPDASNANQTNTDGDGFGDACDNCPALSDPSQEDSDSDSVGEPCDNCVLAYNPDQLDTDLDGRGNACDNCVTVSNASQLDTDSDQRGNACDNCPLSYNPFQADFDVDRHGDACDNCLFDYNPTQSDFNSDNQGDLCDLNDGLIYLFNTGDPAYIEWQAEQGFSSWNVYEGDVAVLRGGGPYTQVLGSNPRADRHCRVADLYVEDFTDPAPGTGVFHLVTGIASGVESSLGANSAGVPRQNSNPCP